jgi:hypothetical protein
MRIILHYLVLVGVPVLGVLGLLQVGERLTAPVSVGGTWSAEIDEQTVDDPACGGLSSWSEPVILTISQSGPNLLLTINNQEKISMAGQIKGMKISARGAVHSSADVTTEIHLEATVDRQAEPDGLLGELTINNCLTPAPLTATRQPKSQGTQGGH